LQLLGSVTSLEISSQMLLDENLAEYIIFLINSGLFRLTLYGSALLGVLNGQFPSISLISSMFIC